MLYGAPLARRFGPTAAAQPELRRLLSSSLPPLHGDSADSSERIAESETDVHSIPTARWSTP